MDNVQFDVLIIGGGLIGASLMLALKGRGFHVGLVDSECYTDRIQPDFDARSLALSSASVQILKMLDVWSLMLPYACPIDTIHVSERTGFGSTRLQADASSPLGYVVEMQHIHHALQHRLDMKHVFAPAELLALDKQQGTATIRYGAEERSFKAKLIVAADGTQSSVRKFCGMTAKIKDYQQHAIVANVGLARPHHYRAYERFTTMGPLALLPMNENRVSMVWALSPEEATRVMALADRDFLATLQRAFGYRLGRLVRVGQRVMYPLRQVISQSTVHGNIVFIGNAAQTLHPVAGQGFNLGLRDVAMLAQCIVNEGLTDEMLGHYQTLRKSDQRSMLGFTDGLIHLFISDFPGVACARRAGLVAFDHLPVFKTLLARFTRGFSGTSPDLVCGIPLGEGSHEL